MEDQIIKEIRSIKDALASKYNYDIRTIFNDIAQKQKTSNRKIVNLKNDKGRLRPAISQRSSQLPSVRDCR